MRTILVILMGVLGLPVWAAPLDLHYGVNEVDINADGVKDMIVRSRWDNGNAHSFDKYLVMVRWSGEYYPEGVYEVPKGTDWNYKFMTSEAADCDLGAYEFSLDKKGMLMVVQYTKAMGEASFCDIAPITTITYQLTDSIKEEDGAGLGLPPFYLKEVKKQVTKRRYESVRDVM